MLHTYRLDELADFILRLIDQDAEDEVWQTWLSKDTNMNYKEFKKKYWKSVRKPHATISKEDEQKALDLAMRFIKPITEGGEKINE